MFRWKKEKKTTSHRCCWGPKTNSCSDLRKTHISKTFANVNKFIRLGGETQPVTALRTEQNSATELGIGGVCEAHLCQRFRERANRRIGVILTDRLRVEVAGFPPPLARWKSKNQKTPLSGAQQHDGPVCVCKTTETPAGDMVQGHRTRLEQNIILHVQFHAHALTGVKASHINSIDSEV